MKNLLLSLTFLALSPFGFSQTTWYEIQTGTNKKLNAIDFPSNDIGYIVGEDTTILKTTDGGQTWTALGLNGMNLAAQADNFTDIQFIDENTGFLVSGYSGVYMTTDGAQSWTSVSYSMCFPHTVLPFSSDNYLVAGGDCFEGAKIDRTENGTSNQSTISTNFWNSNEIVLEMSFHGTNRGLAATKSTYMLRTVDGGNHWDTISTGIQSELTSVVMVNDTLCYAGYTDPSSQGFGILKSEDGGLTWGMDVNSATFYYPDYLSVCAANNGDIYSGAVSQFGPGGLMFESTNGVSWNYQDVDHPINDLTSIGSDITFGVGDSGYLIVNTPVNQLNLTSLDQVEFDAYPNPFQQEITVENPTSHTLTSSILDASGRKVKTQILELGENIINCEGMKAGVYLLEVIHRDSRVVKRIIKQ